MPQFIKQGNTFYRKDDTGNLYAVSDKDTISGLDSGQLPYFAIGSNRALSFAGETSSKSPTPANNESGDIASMIKEKLTSAIKNYAGADTTSLETKRQELLRKQLLADPYSAEGESKLTGEQKFSLLRSKGTQFEPEIQAIEKEIIQKKNLPIQELQTLSAMTSLAESLGLFEGNRLEELKLSHPEISFADTMEEALGYLGSEIKKDKELERKLKQAQINASLAAISAKNNHTAGTQLPSSQVVMLSDAKFLPGVLDNLEKVINDNEKLFGLGNAPFLGISKSTFSEKKSKIEDDLRRAAQLVGKFMEGGVLRAEDEIKYRKMLPQLQDLNSQVALDKLEGVREMLGLKYNNYIIDFGNNGYAVSAFPTLEFGNKTNSERIKVKLKDTGQTGTILENEFDPNIYIKL